MSYEERSEWKKAAKQIKRTEEFRLLQKKYQLFKLENPGTGEPIPHSTYYVKNSEASELMNKVYC